MSLLLRTLYAEEDSKVKTVECSIPLTVFVRVRYSYVVFATSAWSRVFEYFALVFEHTFWNTFVNIGV